mgnify:CR=1 FL=1
MNGNGLVAGTMQPRPPARCPAPNCRSHSEKIRPRFLTDDGGATWRCWHCGEVIRPLRQAILEVVCVP